MIWTTDKSPFVTVMQCSGLAQKRWHLEKFLLPWPSGCKSRGIYPICFYSTKLYTSGPRSFQQIKAQYESGSPIVEWPGPQEFPCSNYTKSWSGPKLQVDSNFEEILWYHILAIRQLIMVLGWLITFAFVVAFYCCFGWLPEWSVGFVSYLCGWKLGWLAGCLYYWLILTIVVCWEYLTTWL